MQNKIFLWCILSVYSIGSTSDCLDLKKRIHILNEMLESNSLSPSAYEISLLELMHYEAQLEECQERENDNLKNSEHTRVKKRSISF